MGKSQRQINDMLSQWTQLKHATPERWKTHILNYSNTGEKNMYQKGHHNLKIQETETN